MLYFASNTLVITTLSVQEAILDIARTNFINLKINPNNAGLIIKHGRKSIINGLDPDRYDIILGLAFSRKMFCNFDQNTVSLFRNQNDVWATLVKKELTLFKLTGTEISALFVNILSPPILFPELSFGDILPQL
jgi:hypothetical protein